MNDRNRIVELLKNYRSYKYAVSNGISPHVAEDNTGMPFNSSYGPRVPILRRGSWDGSTDDFRRYSCIVRMIEGAVNDVLSDDEQKVIRYKYMERNTLRLCEIADRIHVNERRAIYLHKKALKSLGQALMFVDVPEIINLDKILA